MRHSSKMLALLALFAIAACSDPARFGGGTNDVDLNAPLGAEGQGFDDPADDPASPSYFSQRVGDRVLFAVDQSTLSEDAKFVLEGQADWLQVNADYQAVIEGHADEQGTTEYNLALGARRANSVKEFLISKGIPENRIRTLTYGKERPAELCAAESCYAKNRRAVTVISIGTLG